MAAAEGASEIELLRSIDRTLSALLAITFDDYRRTQNITGAREKPVEALLHDAGMSTGDIATLLNKTQRAVQLAVQPKGKSK